jgi:hypothetical protein
VSWDSKITTINALLGGVGDIVREKMKVDGIYNEFITVLQVTTPALFHVSTWKIEEAWLTETATFSENTVQCSILSRERMSSFVCPM